MPDVSAPDAPPTAPQRPAEYRYAAVFGLTLLLVVWQIVASEGELSRAVGFSLECAALIVVVATSRTRADVRRVRVGATAAIAGAIVVAVAAGALPLWLVAAGGGLLSLAIPLTLVGGLLRLVRTHGVTPQAVAGSLAIYLFVGLFFAELIAVFAHFDPAPYFASGATATQSARVYYSFTVLTTTGFGDLTAASPPGRALSVVEMLIGQLYLVTVIGVLVGSFGRRR
jgi:hypothetical protein